jgi:hypothetical protein
MNIIKQYKIYCENCQQYQPFSADFESDWTDLVCDVCRLVIATIEKIKAH